MKEIPRQQTNNVVTMDAAGQTLGRLASQVAHVLRGKARVDFRPNVVPDVTVVVLNVGKLRFTGLKLKDKLYHRFSGYPGGITTQTLAQRFEKNPAQLVRDCVKHMLPKNRLQAKLLNNLTIYQGSKN